MSDFEKATRPDATGRPGRFGVTLDEQWGIGPRLHGGYLLAVCARAAVEGLAAGPPTEHTAPHAVTGTYLRAPVPGPADLDVVVLRRGRSVSQLRVRLDQGDDPCLEAAVTLAAPVPADAPGGGPDVAPPAVTPFDDCPRSPSATDDGRGSLPLMDVVDTRLDPTTAGFVRGAPSGRGRVAGWGALADGTAWSPVSLLVALDLMPPALFDLGLMGWTPTMSLTAHVPAVPAPGPVRLEQVVDHLHGERMHESCRAWDADGRLVGIATQVAAVRRR